MPARISLFLLGHRPGTEGIFARDEGWRSRSGLDYVVAGERSELRTPRGAPCGAAAELFVDRDGKAEGAL